MRAAGAGATAAAAAGGALTAAVAATGRGTAVGDRGRGCRRRSGWVRPGPGRAVPLPVGRPPGLCVGRSGRERRRRPRPGRGDAPVARARGAGLGGGRRDGRDGREPRRTCRPDKGAPGPGNSRRPVPAAAAAERGPRQLPSCQRFPSVTGRESLAASARRGRFWVLVSSRCGHKLC